MTVWTSRSDTPWLDAVRRAASLYQAKHPNVTVDVTGDHSDFGEVVESFGTGQAPDVIEPGDLVPLMARSMVEPLDRYLPGSSIDSSNYPAAMWANGSWRGKTYGIPALDHGPELGLAWNTSLTATASAPASWDDLYVFGRQLTQRDSSGAITMLGFDPLDGVGGLVDTVRDVTGQEWFDPASSKVNLDNPAYQSFLTGVASYYNALGLEQVLAFRKTYRPLTNTGQSAVNAGRQVAILDGYWSVAEIARLAHDQSWQFGYAWVPSVPSGQRIQRIGGRLVAIPTVARTPDDSWPLLEVLCGDAANKIMCDAVGTFAMTRSFLKSDNWKSRPGMQFYADSMERASRVTSRSNNVVAGFAQEKWVQALGAILSGSQSVADALKTVQSSVDAEVSKVRR